MWWMAQPDQRFAMQLANTFPADLKLFTDLSVEVCPLPIQPVTGNHDLA
jgi:hypothetical protein